MKLKKLLICIAGVGFTSAMVFSIRKGYREYKEGRERREREIREEYEAMREQYMDMAGADFDGDCIPESFWQREIKYGVLEYPETAQMEIDYDDYEDDDYNPDDAQDYRGYWGYTTEGERKMRWPAESKEALEQYKMMRLADFAPDSPIRATLLYLFDVPYYSTNEGDERMEGALCESRHDFFGEGKYVTDLTVADLVLHYAEMLEFDLDGSISGWAKLIVRNMGLMRLYEFSEDEVLEIVHNILHHTHTNSRGYGLFGLKGDAYVDMLRRADDGVVTFNNEYNSFLAHMMGLDTEGGVYV